MNIIPWGNASDTYTNTLTVILDKALQAGRKNPYLKHVSMSIKINHYPFLVERVQCNKPATKDTVIILDGGDSIGDLDLNFFADRLKPINHLICTRLASENPCC